MKSTILIVSTLIPLIISGQLAAQKKKAAYFPKDQFTTYKDSLVYSMTDPGSFGSHGVYRQGKRFRFQLPKKLVDYTAYTHELSFQFPDGQYVFVDVNHDAKGDEQDSTFVPTEDQLRHYLPLVHWADEFAPYMPKEGRKTKMYTKYGCQILLLNIKPKNFERFMAAVNSFRIIKYSE